MATSSEIRDWASAFIAFQDDSDSSRQDHPLFWATARFMNPPSEAEAENCWAAILEILARNPSDQVIGMLAAGPLEDLIHGFGPIFIDRIERQARQDRQFLELLGGVWESSTPAVWARIEAIRGKPW